MLPLPDSIGWVECLSFEDNNGINDDVTVEASGGGINDDVTVEASGGGINDDVIVEASGW